MSLLAIGFPDLQSPATLRIGSDSKPITSEPAPSSRISRSPVDWSLGRIRKRVPAVGREVLRVSDGFDDVSARDQGPPRSTRVGAGLAERAAPSRQRGRALTDTPQVQIARFKFTISRFSYGHRDPHPRPPECRATPRPYRIVLCPAPPQRVDELSVNTPPPAGRRWEWPPLEIAPAVPPFHFGRSRPKLGLAATDCSAKTAFRCNSKRSMSVDLSARAALRDRPDRLEPVNPHYVPAFHAPASTTYAQDPRELPGPDRLLPFPCPVRDRPGPPRRS